MAEWMIAAAAFTLGLCTAIIPPYGRSKIRRVLASLFKISRRDTFNGGARLDSLFRGRVRPQDLDEIYPSDGTTFSCHEDRNLGENQVRRSIWVGAITTINYWRYSRDVIFGIRFPMVNAKLAWMVMESPNVAVAAWCFARSNDACRNSPANMILLCLFVAHYVNRSFVFPLRMRGGRPMPLLVTATAFVFCTFNGYLQCSHLLYAKPYPNSWLRDPRFVLGMGTFVLGFWINYDSDGILRQLRGPKESDYKIPRGGLFEHVSGANFFGESLEWCGFALAGWSLPALAFALYTISNLAPRAYRHHQWYLEKFEDYPSNRKAFVPLVW